LIGTFIFGVFLKIKDTQEKDRFRTDLKNKIESLKIGDNQTQVYKIMGAPDTKGYCNANQNTSGWFYNNGTINNYTMLELCFNESLELESISMGKYSF
jgi:hypothetical protein